MSALLTTALRHATFSADTQELNMYHFHNTDYPCLSAVSEGINLRGGSSRGALACAGAGAELAPVQPGRAGPAASCCCL